MTKKFVYGNHELDIYVGGIIAPNQKVFPEYDKGLFELDKTDIIISAGLGNTSFLPRYGNPPEICIVDIK